MIALRFSDEFLLTATPVATYLYVLPRNAWSTKLARLTEEDFPGFKFNERTLAAANVVRRSIKPGDNKSQYDGSNCVVQVTSSGVSVVNMVTRIRESRWSPPDRGSIVLADISPSQICVALAGGKIVLLNLEGENIEERGSVHDFPHPDCGF